MQSVLEAGPFVFPTSSVSSPAPIVKILWKIRFLNVLKPFSRRKHFVFGRSARIDAILRVIVFFYALSGELKSSTFVGLLLGDPQTPPGMRRVGPHWGVAG